MTKPHNPIFIGETPLKQAEKTVHGKYVAMLGEMYYKIENFDAMASFFMSIVSSSDHWLFVASTGGLTAGRVNAEHALFPYYTEDKVAENHENTGPRAVFLVTRAGRTSLWEPFSARLHGVYEIERNLYKNVTGTALVFEEANHDLGLMFRYAWRTSEKFGFVKTSWLVNDTDSACRVELLDGLQNILPANVTSQTQNTFSCLLDAYKRSETHPASGLAMFALNSTLTDLAEPSESLLANTVLQVGLEVAGYLLSSKQLDRFRAGRGIEPEMDIRGRRGAYFVHAMLDLDPRAACSWHLVADVTQDSSAVAQKIAWLQGDKAELVKELELDIAEGQKSLWKMIASADGVQLTNNHFYSAHHFANVMFNLMRGGIFADQYWIDSSDFREFVAGRNLQTLEANPVFFEALPARIRVSDLQARAKESGSAELIRMSYTYLPLTFSRRHGDPSRPWNRFAINIKKPDGSLKLDYEGNWRDIFQNWEALAYSYPEFTESMISTFLNATTVDGYNPYRITHHGIDWEAPEPGNPWANIGYWSDHQVIYLQKLMEISLKLHPGKLEEFLSQAIFSYANVPYKIKPYADLLKDPYNTIEFDWELESQIEERVKSCGADGKLVYAPDGRVMLVGLTEKLLTLLLAKLSNFVPEGGIWMSTQRPEWNDANNALVGKGISVVTLCYLRRYIVFFKGLMSQSQLASVPVSSEVHQFYVAIAEILVKFQPVLAGSFNDEQRRAMLNALGGAGSAYRWDYYQNGLSGRQTTSSVAEIIAFLDLAQQYVDHTLRANKRTDKLYHSYNVLHLGENRATINYLYEMLEGQVAILSSDLLNADESLALMKSLRNSALYQPEQNTYILYPDRNPKGFLEKNHLTQAQVNAIPLFMALVEAGDKTLIVRDINGVYHFAGQIRNFHGVSLALESLKKQPAYEKLVDADFAKISDLFENTFRHAEFTGRSGTFFAYEGLGSVYWHMVAKLILEAQETALRFYDTDNAATLLKCYLDVRRGLGFNKSPDEYGAFPTDPYSHTPKGQGAKQPGMTGMVKEIILARQAELGYMVEVGKLVFNLQLLEASELLTAPVSYSYLDVNGVEQKLELKAGSLAYTICQVPVILEKAATMGVTVHFADGRSQHFDGNALDEAASRHIFQRDGSVSRVIVAI